MTATSTRDPGQSVEHARTGSRGPSRGAKRGGNLVSIIINGVLLYLINAHPGWYAAPFLTPSAAHVVGLVNLTLAAGIVANIVYLIAEPRWLRAIGDVATLTIAVVTTVRILQVFPFVFHGSWAFMTVLAPVLLILGIAGASIGILYSVAVLIGLAAKAGQ